MDQPSSADSRLSNYRLERLLGAGGMGSVYLARDLALDRLVAIKFISPDRAGDDSARRRLIREARAAAALEHPNICGVHEVIDAPDGRACIVMQYVEGRTLADVLRDGPLDVRLALSVAADLSSALAAAHRHGIIHRDLKPQNVILTTDHHAKLLDFGVARHADSATAASDSTTATQLTTPGVIVGTPSYMSPEQVLQRPLDGRSDLFALGAVLFECLTGRRPFQGQSGLEQVSGVLHDEPPPVSSLRSGLNDQHDEFVHRLLAKAPVDRFSSADEVLGALRVLMPDEASARWRAQQEPRGWFATRRRKRTALAVAAVAIILAAAGVWKWTRPAPTFEGTPEARRLYDLGTEWIRRGAYSSGRRALADAVQASPGYVPAYVRLAEASSELDDYLDARDALLTVDELLADVRDLGTDDRLRLEGVRALVLRKTDAAVESFRQIADRHPRDAGALVDLGRAQETAAMTREAARTYQRALQVNPSYPAAHLRLAGTLADRNDREALRSFDRGEELYLAESNVEGQIEAALRRGAFLNVLGELTPARHSLERALKLADELGHEEQAIRARLSLSSVTASEGRFEEAQKIAAGAVQDAVEANLDTVAANGLIDLANVLLHRQQKDTNAEGRLKAIKAHLDRAISLAEQREARRIKARAALVQASVNASWGDDAGALEVAGAQVPFLRENGYRRLELNALLIMSRAHEGLGDLENARQLAGNVLAIAEQLEDESQQGVALDILAACAVAVGALPEANVLRKRAEDIHRRQNDAANLPFDLTNRAELLIRLGRPADARALLDEVQKGIDQKLDSFVARARRLQGLRALDAATSRRSPDVVSICGDVLSQETGDGDAAGRLCARLIPYAQAHIRSTHARVHADWLAEKDVSSPAARELRYWELAARLAAGEAAATKAQALQTLTWKDVSLSPEYEWRIAAVAAAAAAASGDTRTADDMRTRAAAARAQLRDSWKDAFASYARRADLVGLTLKAGLNHQP